jgi:hypothetical protein
VVASLAAEPAVQIAKGNDRMKLKTRLMLFAAATALSANMAHAAISGDDCPAYLGAGLRPPVSEG